MDTGPPSGSTTAFSRLKTKRAAPLPSSAFSATETFATAVCAGSSLGLRTSTITVACPLSPSGVVTA
ncbi:MAG: hypothetical protein AcusKO_45730 [Acuticoccus sp.]